MPNRGDIFIYNGPNKYFSEYLTNDFIGRKTLVKKGMQLTFIRPNRASSTHYVVSSEDGWEMHVLKCNLRSAKESNRHRLTSIFK